MGVSSENIVMEAVVKNFIKNNWFTILLILIAALSYIFVDWSEFSIINLLQK